MNLDQYLVTSTYYRVRFLEPEKESEGGIALPDNALPEVQSAVVLAHGPGKIMNSGARYPMQCGVGDLVVAQSNHFDPLGDGEAFVADEHLVAFQRYFTRPWGDSIHDGDEVHGCEVTGYGPLVAANDWVLVRPDAAKQIDPVTGATVARTDSPIVVVAASVAGGEIREVARARECIEEMEAIVRSKAYREQPSQYYKDRMIHNYLDGLSQWEFDAVGRELKKKNTSNLRSLIPARRTLRATAGEVVSVGPGRVQKWSIGCDIMTADRCQLEGAYEDGGWIDCIFAGDRVHFDRNFKAVALFSDEGSVWALRCRDIAAVEVSE